MRTSRRLPSILAVTTLAALLGALPGGRGLAAARAAEPAPENPFLDLAQKMRVGSFLRTRGVILATLEIAPALQPSLTAKAGLAETATDILPLPGPAGLWHVRVTNREKLPLLIPAGETLLTPTQPSRSTDRAVWIAPGAATFVPVVQRQAQGEPPQGPYFSRGRGLTPVELALIPSDRWSQRTRTRNTRLGVVGVRVDDAAAAYATPGFEELLERYRAPLDTLAKGRSVVGVIAADDRGIHFAHLMPNHDLFLTVWPALRDGLVLDAAMVEAVGQGPRPGDEGRFRREASHLLRVLRTKPLNRPTFGEGWEYRWLLSDPDGSWDGLGIAEGPICLTMHRNPAGPPTAPGTGPTDPPESPVPGDLEVERRRRATEFEGRLRDRRRAMPNGPDIPRGGGAQPPSNPAGSAPGAPSRPSSPSGSSPAPAPAPAPSPPSPGPPSPGPSAPGRR